MLVVSFISGIVSHSVLSCIFLAEENPASLSLWDRATSCTIFTLVRLAKMICFIILVGLVHVSSKQFEVVFHLIFKDLLLTKVVKTTYFLIFRSCQLELWIENMFTKSLGFMINVGHFFTDKIWIPNIFCFLETLVIVKVKFIAIVIDSNQTL